MVLKFYTEKNYLTEFLYSAKLVVSTRNNKISRVHFWAEFFQC